MIGSGETIVERAIRTRTAESVTRKLLGRASLDRISALFLATFVAATAVYGWLRPDYNWDMVAYVATALENRAADANDLHARTWAEIEPGARESQLYHLRYSNPYNRHQWENPADFQSQLSMYRVKIAYIALLRWLEPITGLANAAILLSVLPAFGLGMLCLYWLWREDSLQAAVLLAPALALADFTHMTTAATPDMLLALVSLGAIYLLARGRELPACLLLIASVLVRPDNLVLLLALLIAAVTFGWRILPMALTFLVGFFAAMLVSRYGDHPGWWAHFYFSCVHIQNSMAGFSPDFSLVDVVRGYVRGVTVSLVDNDWPALFLVLLAAWALLARAGKAMDARKNALMFALAIGALGKFASFPLPDDRFYFVFIAGMAVLIATIWKPRFDVARS